MLIEKENLPLVAMEFMNDVHMEDVDIINNLFEQVLAYENDPSAVNEKKVNSLYKEWFEHTVDHFHGEEEMMQERAFPPYPMHKGEHDNALYRMEQVFNNWLQTKNINVLKAYMIEELIPWLDNHIKTMDTVTAMFFKTGLSPCSAH